MHDIASGWRCWYAARDAFNDKAKKSLPKSKKGETGSRVLLSLKSSCGVSQALGTADTNSLSHAVLELDRSRTIESENSQLHSSQSIKSLNSN